MLSLDQIKNGISRLKELEDPDEIQSGIHEIFYELMCADQPFYLIYSKECPLMIPVSADQTHLYLRLFSHKELAEKFAKRAEQPEVRELTLLEVIQVGYRAFLAGAYGYILNEGDLWIGSSIPDFLSLFFSRIYGEENFIDSECVDTINFINEVRRNTFFRYGAVCDEEGTWTGTVQQEQLPAITVQSLFHVPEDILTVKRDDEILTIPKDSLLKGLSLCNLEENPDEPVFETSYVDKLKTEFFGEDDWRVTDLSELALTFAPVQPLVQEPVLSGSETEERKEECPADEKEPDETVEEKDNSAAEREEKEPEPVKKKKAGGWLSGLFKKRPKIIAQKPVQAERQEEEAVQNAEESSEKEVPANEDAQISLDEESKSRTKKPSAKRKNFSKKTVIICIAAVLIAAGISIFAIREIQYRENLKNFQTCILYQDYANAYTLYTDTDFGKAGDDILTDELDSLILRYANNEISAEELSASLDALMYFRSIAQNLEIARLTASKLEESKNAFVKGKESADIYERLDIWRQVVQLDTSNYAAVQQNVADSQVQYVNVLRADIEYYRTRVLDFAKNRFDVLSYWYPDDPCIPLLSREFASEQTVPLSFYPVKIYETNIRQETNSYWTLHIGWRNMSVKTIDSICFSVVALGDDGNIVTCEDAEGEWNIFDANDGNRYEPGEEPASGYYWYRAFYGPDVREVKLTAVNITYRDGSTATYTSETDLYSLQSK